MAGSTPSIMRVTPAWDARVMDHFPNLVRSAGSGGTVRFALGHPLVDSYLAFVADRCRPNTARAVAHELKAFFTVVDRDPVEVSTADVFDFLAHQRGDRKGQLTAPVMLRTSG